MDTEIDKTLKSVCASVTSIVDGNSMIPFKKPNLIFETFINLYGLSYADTC